MTHYALRSLRVSLLKAFIHVPVCLLGPCMQMVVDRSTIERHLATSATDPFARSPLTMAQVKPATDVAAAISAWREAHGDTQ